MKGTNLGEFEELVLLIVLILQEEAYVLKIKEEVYSQINRNVAMGALHSTLSRLEKKGFLESEMLGATKERGGRRKRIYNLTSLGKTVLKEAKEQRQMLWQQVPDYALKFIYV